MYFTFWLQLFCPGHGYKTTVFRISGSSYRDGGLNAVSSKLRLNRTISITTIHQMDTITGHTTGGARARLGKRSRSDQRGPLPATVG